MNRRELIKGLAASVTLSVTGIKLGKARPFIASEIKNLSPACPIWPLYNKQFVSMYDFVDGKLQRDKLSEIVIILKTYVPIGEEDYFTMVYYDMSHPVKNKFIIDHSLNGFIGNGYDIRSFVNFKNDSFNRFKFNVHQTMKHYIVDDEMKKMTDPWGNPLIYKKEYLLNNFKSFTN